ncbi:MAG: hypothetical protein RLZZ436_431 [Planctomycetota bacterium]
MAAQPSLTEPETRRIICRRREPPDIPRPHPEMPPAPFAGGAPTQGHWLSLNRRKKLGKACGGCQNWNASECTKLRNVATRRVSKVTLLHRSFSLLTSHFSLTSTLSRSGRKSRVAFPALVCTASALRCRHLYPQAAARRLIAFSLRTSHFSLPSTLSQRTDPLVAFPAFVCTASALRCRHLYPQAAARRLSAVSLLLPVSAEIMKSSSSARSLAVAKDLMHECGLH